MIHKCFEKASGPEKLEKFNNWLIDDKIKHFIINLLPNNISV